MQSRNADIEPQRMSIISLMSLKSTKWYEVIGLVQTVPIRLERPPMSLELQETCQKMKKSDKREEVEHLGF